MNFNMTKPCRNCPFLTTTLPYISTARAEEITEGVMNDITFTCHKTLDKPDREHEHCAGAMIFLEKQNNPNQMMRISQRFGDYDPTCLDMESKVYDSPEAMVRAVGIWNGDIDE